MASGSQIQPSHDLMAVYAIAKLDARGRPVRKSAYEAYVALMPSSKR